MAAFTVHEPPNAPVDRMERAEQLLFVPEGFSWAAALFTPFWLASHRLWKLLAAYFGGLIVVSSVLTAIGINPAITCVLILAAHIWFGFEGNELRRSVLASQGWTDAGAVSGRTADECERRFFGTWLVAERPREQSGMPARPEA